MTAYPTEARTLTFNKDNWTGETATVKVEEGNRFEINGDKFWLVDTTPEDQEDEPGSKYYFRRLELHGEGWSYPLTKICWFDGDRAEEKFQVSGTVEREGADPVIAAARYIFNCV